jgi:hypothetical protein
MLVGDLGATQQARQAGDKRQSALKAAFADVKIRLDHALHQCHLESPGDIAGSGDANGTTAQSPVWFRCVSL